MSTAPISWFAAFLAPDNLAQDRARRYAEALGFQSYTPMATRLQKRPDRRPSAVQRGRGVAYRTEAVRLPLWPRYVFLALPVGETPFGRFTNREALVQGFRGFVTVAGTPLHIPTREIEELRQREAGGEFDTTARRGRRREIQPDARFVVGDAVTISAGPFRDFVARICANVGDGRLQAEVNIFGRSTPIDLDLEQLAQVVV